MSTVAAAAGPAPSQARPGAPIVCLDAVCFAYREATVLDGVSLSVHSGELVALAGPNGSGKSTLVRVLLGLLPVHGGRVRVFGQSPEMLRDRWRIGYVPQRPVVAELLPSTVADIVAAGRVARRGWWRRPTASDPHAVQAALGALGLSGLRDRRLGELSGGEQQRAFIAKALACGPELVVLDEPAVGVDAEAHLRLRDALVAACAGGAGVLVVSHDLGPVAAELDRVVLLHQGRAVFDGAPEAPGADGGRVPGGALGFPPLPQAVR